MCALLGLGLALFWHDSDTRWQSYFMQAGQSIPREGGNHSDLYPRWLGARELLLHGRNPYSPEVTADIQRGFYGRAIEPGGPIRDAQAFAYPLTVVPLLAPFVTLPFAVAAPLLIALMLLATGVGLRAWAETLRPGARAWHVAALLVPLATLPMMEAVNIQQLSLLSLALMAGMAAMLSRGHMVGAGVALAVLTFKPQLALLLLAGVTVWASGAPGGRRLLLALVLTLASLLALSTWLLPTWVGDFQQGLSAYTGYVPNLSSLVQVFLGDGPLAVLCQVLIVVSSLDLWWRARGDAGGGPRVQWAFATSVAATVVLVPDSAIYNRSLLILPLLYLAAASASAGPSRGRSWLRLTAGQLAALAFVSPGLVGLLRRLPFHELANVVEYAPYILWGSFLPLAVLAALLPWRAAWVGVASWLSRATARVREHLYQRQAEPEQVG